MAWCLVGSRLEEIISLTAATAFGQNELVSVVKQFSENGFRIRILYHRTDGYLEKNILSILALPVVTRTRMTVFSKMMPIVTVVQKRVEMGIRHKGHGTAFASISAIGTTLRLILGAAERDGTCASFSASDGYCYVVDKFHDDGP